MELAELRDEEVDREQQADQLDDRRTCTRASGSSCTCSTPTASAAASRSLSRSPWCWRYTWRVRRERERLQQRQRRRDRGLVERRDRGGDGPVGPTTSACEARSSATSRERAIVGADLRMVEVDQPRLAGGSSMTLFSELAVRDRAVRRLTTSFHIAPTVASARPARPSRRPSVRRSAPSTSTPRARVLRRERGTGSAARTPGVPRRARRSSASCSTRCFERRERALRPPRRRKAR